MHTDTIFYQIFLTFHTLLFEILGEPTENAKDYQFTLKFYNYGACYNLQVSTREKINIYTNIYIYFLLYIRGKFPNCTFCALLSKVISW